MGKHQHFEQAMGAKLNELRDINSFYMIASLNYNPVTINFLPSKYII